MPIELNGPFTNSGIRDEWDVRQMKKALNRLGYYVPDANGITGRQDQKLFDALKEYQRMRKLPVTGMAAQDDATVKAINEDLENQRDGNYIWRCVYDGKVRPAHRKFKDTIRAWGDSPDPGEDFNCRCWAEPLSNSAEARKKAILGEGQADFSLKPDLEPHDEEPGNFDHSESEVLQNDQIIIEEARKAGVNPDLIRGIIYVETTQGWYDRAFNTLGINRSIRPMNVSVNYWRELGYSREQLQNPRLNIRAGTDLLKRIQQHMPNASIAEIATMYNDLNAKRISDYGARVERIIRERAWLKKEQ